VTCLPAVAAQACADKLKKEVAAFGNPPKFPAAESEAEPAGDDEAEEAEEAKETAKPAADAKAPEEKVRSSAAQHGGGADRAALRAQKRSKKGKEQKKKSGQKYQWNIMLEMARLAR
jgi:hypothetical protein